VESHKLLLWFTVHFVLIVGIFWFNSPPWLAQSIEYQTFNPLVRNSSSTESSKPRAWCKSIVTCYIKKGIKLIHWNILRANTGHSSLVVSHIFLVWGSREFYWELHTSSVIIDAKHAYSCSVFVLLFFFCFVFFFCVFLVFCRLCFFVWAVLSWWLKTWQCSLGFQHFFFWSFADKSWKYKHLLLKLSLFWFAVKLRV